MLRILSIGTALVVCLTWQASAMAAARGATPFAAQAAFTIPPANVAATSPILDGSHIVYGVSQPRFHRPVCVSCGQRPFAAFRVQMYVRDYAEGSSSITISRPRLLFEGPQGAQILAYSLVRGWLVYATVRTGDRWELVARNISHGNRVPLDSPSMEGLPSRFLNASTDGRTVVWQAWTKLHGRETSVIRSYSLTTRRRRLLLAGGHGQDYFYVPAQIAGTRLILEKDSSGPSTQILLENLVTRHLRALTPPGQMNFEAFVSGDTLAWVHGQPTTDHVHGIVVANLATGRRVALKRSSAKLARIVEGRYVVFVTDYQRPSVQVYDTQTGRRWTVASGNAPGFSPSSWVETGGNSMLFAMTKPCGSPGRCPAHLVLASLTP